MTKNLKTHTEREFSSFQRSKIAILNFQKTKEKIVKVET